MYDVPSWKKELQRRLDEMRSRKAKRRYRVRKAAEVKVATR